MISLLFIVLFFSFQGHTAAYKTVSAVAEVDSTILRLPAKAFKLVLDRFPESLVRVVQVCVKPVYLVMTTS